MLKKISLIFGSKTKAEEILYLLNNKKKVVRQGFYESELWKIEKFCQENGLCIAKSKFKVLLADTSEAGQYSNKGIRVPAHDPREGMYFVYISKEEQKSWLAAYYELMNNDNDLGILLGYPQCCVEFFCKRFTPDNPNLQLNPTNTYTNLTKRNEDCVLLSHFPCHSECPESIRMARENYFLIKEIDEERAKEIIDKLRV